MQYADADHAAGVDVGVEHVAGELHGGRGEGVVLGEGEEGGEDAVLEGGGGRALDEGFPGEQVVLVDGPGGYAGGGVVGQIFVFGE